MYLVFDTETTGLPRRKDALITNVENWPRLVQLAWQLHLYTGKSVAQHSYIITPEGFDIPFKAEQVHGISSAKALAEGHPIKKVLQLFSKDLRNATALVGHNVEFDIPIVGSELARIAMPFSSFTKMRRFDTCVASVSYCQLPGGPGGKFKMPKLNELYKKLFGSDFDNAHNAQYDVMATAQCFFKLIQAGVIALPKSFSADSIHYEPIQQKKSSFAEKEVHVPTSEQPLSPEKPSFSGSFSHLHTHSQFSILQATASVEALLAEAKAQNMPAVALTDLGNLYGAFKFVSEAEQQGVKPIIGCEFFLSEERKRLKFTKNDPDRRYRQVLLAKNKTGYANLIKLSSLGFSEGLYGLYPRIDKALVSTRKEGLIATTGSLSSEIPHLILHMGTKQAEIAFQWWHDLFKDDFYVELNRHGLPEEDHVNQVLLKLCKKYSVPYFAANELYYLHKKDADAHDILLCIKAGEMRATPIGSGRGYRYGMPNQEFYFKTQEEMKTLFHDLPEALEVTEEIVKKVEPYTLSQPVLLPKYTIPVGFKDENEYLRHITYEGAHKRYKNLTQKIKSRIDFELDTIKKTKYPGYFLITQDFTRKAREMGAFVGPGRGSAAGSVVAYCTGITNIDPIAYNLLFERFLNPDRISLPDIDIDFDNESREKVLNYVIDKYGRTQVAQIITYGIMGAKSAIRDCARVMQLPLAEANYLAKLVPEKPGISLKKALTDVEELGKIGKGNDLKAQILQQAPVIEGSLRSTGTHACGVIITPCALDTLAPIALAKDSDMLVTQFDNSVVEKAGMLKMDFLGLTTLSILKTALGNIKKRRGEEIDIERIPLDDKKTFELYQRGETAGTFQFESEGMQAYLKELNPDRFEELIAMNALYRPGPMEYIPNFIARKHGREKIHYDLPGMESVLKDTYGVTVYQEQVMLLSQQLAGFSKGDADVLRKAMGKKQKKEFSRMKDKFIAGCRAHGIAPKKAEKIWKDWEAFAQYAFNKSHSTCYSLIAYQTAYLKANYPNEYMAAVLTHTRHNLEKVTFFIESSRKQGLHVLGPHINESGEFFDVNDKGEIRFGLGGIKGLGEAATQAIISEREQQGSFKDVFDLVIRLNQQTVNRKVLESLALSGAFDCFSAFHRRQFVYAKEGDMSLTEKLIRYAAKKKQEGALRQGNLFEGTAGATISLPKTKEVSRFSEIEKLHFEKEAIGVYISGHPLDSFRFEIDSFCNTAIEALANPEQLQGKKIKIGGLVSSATHKITKHGNPFGKMMIEDYSGSFEFVLWSADYLKFKSFLAPGLFLFIESTPFQKTWGDKALEFKITNIELLNELGARRTHSLQLTLSGHSLKESTIDQIEKLCSRFAGKCPLFLTIQDKEKEVSLKMLSRKYQVNPDNDMISALRNIHGLVVNVVQ